MSYRNISIKYPNEINVDVSSPSTSVDATINLPSATESTVNASPVDNNCNVILQGLPGPQGPIGPSGPSGEQGPQGSMGIPNTGELDQRYVLLTGDQRISGIKDFDLRPTVDGIPVMLSGDPISLVNATIEQYIKNDEGVAVYKGQPVYVNGSNGNNILVKLSRNTGEATSSKTFGLLKQDLAKNELGYVVTEGVINNINTSMANEGDPIWLGPSGNLIFGLTNKPYAPNHLVYLGFVEYKHQNQGKIFVKVQNGFELEELHNVNINHYSGLANNQVLKYNSQSGLWFNQTLSSNDLSDKNYVVYTTGNQTIIESKLFSGNNTSVNFISGASFKISGNSVLTGIVGTGNFVSFNDLNKDYQKIYISNAFGNNATAQIGNKYRPYASLQFVWDNLIFPNPSPRYVLNIDDSTNLYSVSINKDWPSTVCIESNGVSSPTININFSSAVGFGASAANVSIIDISDKKILLNITLNAPTYAGGLGNNGGNGGNVFLKNCLVTSINSIGANGVGAASFNGGKGGNITLYGCEVLNSINTIGGYNAGGAPSTTQGGGDVYVENTKFTSSSPGSVILISTNGFSTTSMGSIKAINSILGGSSNAFVTIGRASNNPTISLNGCSYYGLSFTFGGNGLFDIKNSINLTKSESVSSSYYSSANLFYNNLSVRNNNLSGIFDNLTLHDNQNRVHAAGSSNLLTIDFASGINIASSITGSLASPQIGNYLKIYINNKDYYIPMYTGIFSVI